MALTLNILPQMWQLTLDIYHKCGTNIEYFTTIVATNILNILSQIWKLTLNILPQMWQLTLNILPQMWQLNL